MQTNTPTPIEIQCHINSSINITKDLFVMQVGDSLLTLPEQLEPYFTQDNPTLISALKEGKIPYQKDGKNSSLFYQSFEYLRATFDHIQGESLIHLMFITSLVQVRTEGHYESRSEARFQSLAEHPV